LKESHLKAASTRRKYETLKARNLSKFRWRSHKRIH